MYIQTVSLAMFAYQLTCGSSVQRHHRVSVQYVAALAQLSTDMSVADPSLSYRISSPFIPNRDWVVDATEPSIDFCRLENALEVSQCVCFGSGDRFFFNGFFREAQDVMFGMPPVSGMRSFNTHANFPGQMQICSPIRTRCVIGIAMSGANSTTKCKAPRSQ